jgi:hypothetical protein
MEVEEVAAFGVTAASYSRHGRPLWPDSGLRERTHRTSLLGLITFQYRVRAVEECRK